MMSASDLCATEDTVLLLLDYLVDPLLPARPSSRDTPSESLQQSVAKQLWKPTLLAHMKLLQRSNDSELDDPDKQLSVTEKKIMDACDISNSLDASKDIPSAEGWPISKVAVLLIDSRKENCFLKHNSMTEGVFSLIEKDLDVSSCISEAMSEGKQKRKKIKVTRNFFEDAVNEDTLQQVAFSAVKEATVLSNSAKDHQSASGRINVTNSKRTEEPRQPEIHDNQEGSHVGSYIEKLTGSSANTSTKSPMQTNKKRLRTNKNGCSINGLSGDFDGPCSVNVDAPPNEEIGNNTDTILTLQINKLELANEEDSRLIISMQLNCVSVHEATAAFCRDPTIDGNRTLQRHNLEDDIALCDKRIQTILNGGDDDLGLKIESLEEDSNGICQGSLAHERICQ
ncbi:hypothetical protein KPL71_009412 [Citrus sinensis]|uniref:Uncharacterized protein n=1 Tax=Citrus sinensis TaxID=2711 RepID=A0ACB8MDD9_CITSI|nr:hypothetical protein KPL71_009412 [Citrus sinensis]